MIIYHSGSLKVSKDTRVFGVSRVVVHEAFGNKGYPLSNGIDFGEERDSLPFSLCPRWRIPWASFQNTLSILPLEAVDFRSPQVVLTIMFMICLLSRNLIFKFCSLFQGMKLVVVSDCYLGFEQEHSIEALVEQSVI